MTLRTLFAIPIAAILLVTLSLTGMMAAKGLTDYQRGEIAILAVERMRLLVLLQTDLWAERVATNAALGQAHPLPELAAKRLAATRDESDRTLVALIARLRAQSRHGAAAEPFLGEFTGKLDLSRATVDTLLTAGRAERRYADVAKVIPSMLSASLVLEKPLAKVSLDVVAADSSLSGLLAISRLAALLKDGVSGIPGVLLPRFNTDRVLTPADAEAVHVLLAQTAQLTKLLRNTIEISEPTDRMLASLTSLEEVDTGGRRQQIVELLQAGMATAHGKNEIVLAQRLIIPWSESVNALRAAIVDTALHRVTTEQHARVHRLWLASLASGAVILATLASLALLHWRVVSPLARLGMAITRIAAGDRATPLAMRTGTREIAEMVTAVETLRHAALIADATALRQRMAARQRLQILREALGIVLTVEEPAKALEQGVASLSAGIDAAISMVAGSEAPAPPTLGTAAYALRLGLAEMRGAAADLDAIIAAARTAQGDDDHPEAEIVARILAVRDHVDRRDAAVRGFIQPSLAALRDAASMGGDGRAMRDLVSEQFLRVEATVAAVSSMCAQVARAAAIVRALPLDETPLAA